MLLREKFYLNLKEKVINLSGGPTGGYVTSRGGGSDIDELEGIARGELKKLVSEPRRKVFISFDSDDLDKKRLLVGQAKNENSDLEFIDYSLKAPFNSENAEYIKSGIRERISQSSVTIVIATDVTHRSDWVNWEIEESFKQNKGVIVIDHRNNKSSKMPDAVNNNQDRVKVVSWNHQELNQAIQDAAEDR